VSVEVSFSATARQDSLSDQQLLFCRYRELSGLQTSKAISYSVIVITKYSDAQSGMAR
jgi:hypothetical protein